MMAAMAASPMSTSAPGAILNRLKPDPVPEALITQVLDAAIRASTAGNAQNWAFVVVRDSEQRRRLGMIYRKASDIASEM